MKLPPRHLAAESAPLKAQHLSLWLGLLSAGMVQLRQLPSLCVLQDCPLCMLLLLV
jgi:hypothetical protein